MRATKCSMTRDVIKSLRQLHTTALTRNARLAFSSPCYTSPERTCCTSLTRVGDQHPMTPSTPPPKNKLQARSNETDRSPEPSSGLRQPTPPLDKGEDIGTYNKPASLRVLIAPRTRGQARGRASSAGTQRPALGLPGPPVGFSPPWRRTSGIISVSALVQRPWPGKRLSGRRRGCASHVGARLAGLHESHTFIVDRYIRWKQLAILTFHAFASGEGGINA